jgi:uncharacterized protein YkwD
VLADINALRKEHGLAPLRLSASLSAAARQHSSEMAARGYFSHDSANGSSFDKRIARYYPMGRSRYWSVGENLLWSSPDVDAGGALEMWWNSPEHRKNMLTARWREIGLSRCTSPRRRARTAARGHDRDHRLRRQALAHPGDTLFARRL